ncbi:hypothetical protein H2202_011170 [Exophiala xenobiotica]|nr:hypothetical protein H2202_011170 [Exophiala xenobiotica]KAK5400040.1 hypothetical protein LTR06_011306 [Exophiala xenobiotica]
MSAVSYNDHRVCHTVQILLAEAGRPKNACHRSCLDDICRDHPNWASYIKKFCVDVRAFLEAITSVPDVAAEAEDEGREPGVLASSGPPRSLAGRPSCGIESSTVGSLAPGTETIPQFSGDEVGAQQTETGAIPDREWTTRTYRHQIPRSLSPLEPGEEGLSQEQVVPEADRESMDGEKETDKSGEEQEPDDIIHVGNDDDKIYHGMDDDNVGGDEQVEEERQENEERKRNRQDREELLTKNPKVPEGISVTSGITLKYVARPSQKRSTRAAILETPSKKSRLADPTPTTPSQPAATVTPESSTDQAYWKEWDMKREVETPDNVQTSGTIKAVRVWDRFCQPPGVVSSNRDYLQDVNPHRVNILVTMVLAVGNSHGFRALKRAMTAAQQGGTPSIADAFSNNPQRLVKTLTAIDTAGDMYAYMRRLALARLARLYRNTAANAGQIAIDDDDTAAWMSRRRPASKDDKAKAYRSMIEHIWGAAFPDRFRGQTMTKSGLIDSDAPEAVQWNQCKRKLSKQIEAGQRWLQWAERLGWSSLGLISRDWSIGDSRVVASDRTFEEMLSVSEHTMLLNAVDTEKGRFLRQVDRAVGGGLFELLADTNRVQRLPLLKLDDEEIMARSDCDPQWVVELTCQQPGS